MEISVVPHYRKRCACIIPRFMQNGSRKAPDTPMFYELDAYFVARWRRTGRATNKTRKAVVGPGQDTRPTPPRY